MLPDAINGLFEFIGGFLNWLNVRALYHDKEVRGVRIFPSFFFFLWGIWNLYYYPHLDQWLSFTGGLVIVGGNAAWVALAVYYTRRKTNGSNRLEQD